LRTPRWLLPDRDQHSLGVNFLRLKILILAQTLLEDLDVIHYGVSTAFLAVTYSYTAHTDERLGLLELLELGFWEGKLRMLLFRKFFYLMFSDTGIAEDIEACWLPAFNQVIKILSFFARVAIIEPKVIRSFPILSLRPRPLQGAQLRSWPVKLTSIVLAAFHLVFRIFEGIT